MFNPVPPASLERAEHLARMLDNFHSERKPSNEMVFGDTPARASTGEDRTEHTLLTAHPPESADSRQISQFA